MQSRRPVGALAAAAAAFGSTLCMAQPTPDLRLSELSLEELSNIEITSVSKRAERLSDAPTSVFVITAADIRRSGANSLPEALRLAPNLQVARVSASNYNISARGLNSSQANKLLVLIDGRSVYSPLFAGVFWDVQDVMLEDVERIEVISGPGATLWGVNAVNGVINVITRSAGASAGTLVAAGAGNQENRVSVRHGASTGAGLDWRIYASRSGQRHTETEAGLRVDDAGHHGQAGFRADWKDSDNRVMLKGDLYSGRHGQPLPGTISTGTPFALGEISLSGANLTGQWERRLREGASVSVRAYYDRSERTVPPTFEDTQEIVDLELRYAAAAIGSHTPVFGAEYRYGRNRVVNSPFIAFLPAQQSQRWVSVFAQDEIALREDLRLTLGLRAERNDYTGTEYLPTARLAWKWGPDQLLWAAVSRSVRAPARLDRDTFVPGQPPFLLRGGPNVMAETARDVEIGYRGQLAPNATLSATLFHTVYDRLRTQEIDPSLTFVFFGNGMQGKTTGLELWGTYQATPAWRLHAGVSRLLMDLELKPGSNDAQAVDSAEGGNPPYWGSLRSSLDLSAQTEVDLILRHVARLSSPEVPRYTALDLRLGWRPRSDVELSLTGQNLLDGGHGEFTDVSTRTQFERALFAKVEWRF
jgi:iron complex outermembrane receptor protein